MDNSFFPSSNASEFYQKHIYSKKDIGNYF